MAGLFTKQETTPTSYPWIPGDLQTQKSYASYVNAYWDTLVDEVSGMIDKEQFMELFVEGSQSKDTEVEKSRVRGNAVAQINEDGEDIPYIQKGQGWDHTWVSHPYRIGMKHTQHAEEEDKYGYLQSESMEVMDAINRTVKYSMIDAIDRGFGDATAYSPFVCADGKYLFDSARPSPIAGVANWSNLETSGVPSEDMLFDAKVNADNMIAHNGDRMPFELKRFWIPQDYEQSFDKLLGTEKEVDNAMNTINTAYKVMPYKVLRELGTPCIIYEQGPAGVASPLKDPRYNGLQLRWRVRPAKYKITYEDPNVMGFLMRMRYAIGCRYPLALRAGKLS